MSIKLMSQVWERDLGGHAPQAVALVMADHADDDGNRIFPSVALIAWKTGYTERQVQRIISSLKAQKVLVVVRLARQHRPTEYRLDLSAAPLKPPFRDDKMSPLEEGRDDVSAARGDISSARGDTAMSPDPSVDPPSEPSSSKSARPRDQVFEGLVLVCYGADSAEKWRALPKSALGQANRYSKELRQVGATYKDLVAFGQWWEGNDWRGKRGQPPTPADVAKSWPLFINWRANRKATGSPRLDTDDDVRAEEARLRERMRAQ